MRRKTVNYFPVMVISQAEQYPFKVCKSMKLRIFHIMVPRGLFLIKRGRGEIHQKIAFLSTIVKNKTTKTEKLIRLLKYPQKPIKLVPELRKNDLTLHKRHVNASHAVHNDLKWHTGGTLSLGEGKAYSTRIKQKMNKRLRTESKLVGVYNLMPHILWKNLFFS